VQRTTRLNSAWEHVRETPTVTPTFCPQLPGLWDESKHEHETALNMSISWLYLYVRICGHDRLRE
jgi:hypothetical protein